MDHLLTCFTFAALGAQVRNSTRRFSPTSSRATGAPSCRSDALRRLARARTDRRARLVCARAPSRRSAIDGFACYAESRDTVAPRVFLAARLERNDYPFVASISATPSPDPGASQDNRYALAAQ
ncbi:MAG: hypothetical protein ABJB78_09055 [Betaproteobacteria bacterium]